MIDLRSAKCLKTKKNKILRYRSRGLVPAARYEVEDGDQNAFSDSTETSVKSSYKTVLASCMLRVSVLKLIIIGNWEYVIEFV